jgi:hypothetical protein
MRQQLWDAAEAYGNTLSTRTPNSGLSSYAINFGMAMFTASS